MAHRIAFNTASLVARETGWRFRLDEWGQQDALTRERTDERAWADICRAIADAGFSAVEIWAAHVDPQRMTTERVGAFRRILEEHGLTPIGLAGALTHDTARVCQQLGISVCNGGLWGTTIDSVRRVSRETGIGFNYENHPEKYVADIPAAIGATEDAPRPTDFGIALDTGWLGTQGIHAPAAVRALGPLIRHIHLKDIRHVGGHDTCRLDEGIVDIPGVLKALADIGYGGWYSWEDEPEDRNPLDIAHATYRWIEQQLDEVTR